MLAIPEIYPQYYASIENGGFLKIFIKFYF